MPKRASDNYIRLCKKITNIEVIKGVNELAKDRLATDQEVCYQLICEGVKSELEKKRKLQELTKNNHAPRP